MGSKGDDLVSLPTPPPPRPAARRTAIDAAMRRFDGIEDPVAPRQPRHRFAWSTMHRRPAGAVVAATLLAVIAIPVVQLGLPDPADIASEEHEPSPLPPAVEAGRSVPAETPQPQADALAEEPEPAQSQPAPAISVREAAKRPSAQEQKAAQDAPAEMMAAPEPAIAAAAPPPPPPPPPPPAARAEQQADEAVAEGQEIVVTGSRIERPRLQSVTPLAVVAPYDGFLSRLQDALGANDRRAVAGMVGFPLRVNFDGDVRTYRSPGDVQRDYARIFTAEVRSAALNLRSDRLRSRDGGRLRGSDRIWFGCGRRSCPSADAVRIREITP